jgi:hypothetical protein
MRVRSVYGAADKTVRKWLKHAAARELVKSVQAP